MSENCLKIHTVVTTSCLFQACYHCVSVCFVWVFVSRRPWTLACGMCWERGKTLGYHSNQPRPGGRTGGGDQKRRWELEHGQRGLDRWGWKLANRDGAVKNNKQLILSNLISLSIIFIIIIIPISVCLVSDLSFSISTNLRTHFSQIWGRDWCDVEMQLSPDSELPLPQSLLCCQSIIRLTSIQCSYPLPPSCQPNKQADKTSHLSLWAADWRNVSEMTWNVSKCFFDS